MAVITRLGKGSPLTYEEMDGNFTQLDNFIKKKVGDSWAQKTSVAKGRDNHTAVVNDGKMYIFGGYDGSNKLGDLWEYDITNDSWTQKTSGATARENHTAVVSNGKMYVFGGEDDNGYLGDLWEYDIANDSWTQKTSGATARGWHTAVVSNGKMYVFGGESNDADYLNSLLIYTLPGFIQALSSDIVLNKSNREGTFLSEALDNLNLFSATKTLDETGLTSGDIISYDGNKFVRDLKFSSKNLMKKD